MRQQMGVTVGLIAMLLAAALPAVAQSSRLEGSWTLNLAKSKYSPGPPSKSMTLKWEAVPGGLKLTTDGVNGEGEASHTETLEKRDGSEAPIEGLEIASTRALKRVNDRTYEEVDRNNGKVMESRRLSISRDGKTLTVTVKGVTVRGEVVNNVLVFDRQ